MFSNRFNTKNDPLVEAVQNAMQDGEIRRQAVAYVNEAFGVYNRNAVVREDLAEYDAAIEEAYKCMKEGEKLADKDYDKDGKIESPKDEVWGSRFRAAKMAGKMEEEQIDELTKPTAKTAHKVLNRSEDDLDKSAKAANRLYSWKMKRYPGKTKKYSGTAELPGAGNVEMHQDKYPGYVTKAGKLTKSATKDTKREIKDRLGKHAKPNLPEETDYSAPDRAAVTRDNKPSTPAQTNAATSGPSAADKAALKNKIKTMQEAAYSAKAARAGKDIGKPGKEFKKIAKSAAARYGSEKRGKKVAGAILKRIRAKHMKEENLEELSAFGKAFAAAKGQNFTFGGKQYSGAMKGQTGSSSAPRPSVTSAPRTNTPGTQGVATGKSFAAIDKATAKADKATPKVTTPSTPSAGAARDVGLTGKAGGETGVNTASGAFGNPNKTGFNARTVSLDRPGNVGARPAGAGAAGTTTSGTSTPAPSSSPEQSRAAPGTFAARSAAGEMKADAASAGVKKLMSMNESVQVGTNKYRIV